MREIGDLIEAAERLIVKETILREDSHIHDEPEWLKAVKSCLNLVNRPFIEFIYLLLLVEYLSINFAKGVFLSHSLMTLHPSYTLSILYIST
jgi:hypothetical protein